MAPRKVEERARSGHVTGQRSLRGRGSRKGLQRAPTNTMLFSDYHLAKLNPQMSYELFGLFVTEMVCQNDFIVTKVVILKVVL